MSTQGKAIACNPGLLTSCVIFKDLWTIFPILAGFALSRKRVRLWCVCVYVRKMHFIRKHFQNRPGAGHRVQRLVEKGDRRRTVV